MTDHLTEEDFSNLLIDDTAGPRVLAHLEMCERCRREMATLRGATSEFNEFGHIWAEHEAANAITVPNVRVVRMGIGPLFALSLGGLIAVCVLVLAFVLRTGPAHSLSIARMQAPSASEVARDNRWMMAMDQDLQSGPDEIVISVSELRGSQQQ